MKLLCNRVLALLPVTAGILFAIAGCKKSGGGESTAISSTVGGNAWAANSPVTGIYTRLTGQFEIGGLQTKDGDSTIISLDFFSPIMVNQPVNSDAAMVDIGFSDSRSQGEYDGGNFPGHSTVIVTGYDSVNHTISGTFTAVVYNVSNGSDSLVVGGGRFNSTYEVR